MIEQHEAMQLLVEACPSFSEEWLAHLQEHGNELLYVAAGAFAEHLLSLHQAGNLSSFPAVASAIERLHTEGSPWVKEFATIGVLEGIQNVWSCSPTDLERFTLFLLPESQAWWKGLNSFWSGKAPYVAQDA
ncbi:hypothetical protein [Niveibacterium sp. SC-1]|uniref:DUF7674 family protein n=1 Tax=Niveibacterium sp. SC-1 TaxID=3135646 RepID=UPI00311DF3C7